MRRAGVPLIAAGARFPRHGTAAPRAAALSARRFAGISSVPLRVRTMPAQGVHWRSAHKLEAAAALPDEHLVLISASPPDSMERAAADVCLVVDVSSSMGSPATIKTDADGDGDESHGLSVLDIVKHTMLTINEILGERDRLALVTFSSEAQSVLGFHDLTAEGKATVADATRSLEPCGSTNLWDGLQLGLRQFQEAGAGAFAGQPRLSHLMLLTDGCPNVVPPRGHEAMLERFLDEHGQVAATSMFGFGYSLDSQLLAALASMGGGQYSFIPDASFVGTTFVHSMANMLSTLHAPCSLRVEAAGGARVLGMVGSGSLELASWGAMLPLGALQRGQSRDVVLRVALPPGSTLKATLDVGAAGGKQLQTLGESDTITASSHQVREGSLEALTVEEQRCRGLLTEHMAATLNLLDRDGPSPFYSRADGDAIDADGFGKAQELQAGLAEEVQTVKGVYSSVGESVALASLLADVQGQYQEAISRPDWWSRWGRHYLRSLWNAHARQQCNNFKDPGVQHYGGSLFQVLRDEADRKFLALPPPKPSLRKQLGSRLRIVRMDSFMDASNPCFHGDNLVRMADGSAKPLRSLRRGDLVAVADGAGVAVVRCLVRTACPGGVADMLSLGEGAAGPYVTPWHPVRRAGGPWAFPADQGLRQVTVPCDGLYSFVVEGASAIDMAGWEGIAWGHGIADDAVARHSFFGTEAVLKVLAGFEGWQEGFVELSGCTRDAATGLVDGLLPAALRMRVSSDLGELQRLHQLTGWTPGAVHVRPDATKIAQKELLLANLGRMWASPADWVFFHVFGMRTSSGGGGRVAERPPAGQTRLRPQPFPYELPAEVQHYVLWCSSPRKEWSDSAITAAIAQEVDAHGGGEFVWYENPKPSVQHEQLHHVQVFWRPGKLDHSRAQPAAQDLGCDWRSSVGMVADAAAGIGLTPAVPVSA